MKICTLCGETYRDQIDFCFMDGEVLQVKDAWMDAPDPVHVAAAARPMTPTPAPAVNRGTPASSPRRSLLNRSANTSPSPETAATAVATRGPEDLPPRRSDPPEAAPPEAPKRATSSSGDGEITDIRSQRELEPAASTTPTLPPLDPTDGMDEPVGDATVPFQRNAMDAAPPNVSTAPPPTPRAATPPASQHRSEPPEVTETAPIVPSGDEGGGSSWMLLAGIGAVLVVLIGGGSLAMLGVGGALLGNKPNHDTPVADGPGPIPEPVPEPAPAPVPVPEPAFHDPAPPEPVPEPATDQAIAAMPVPGEVPAPAPEPAPVAAPTPTPAPASVITKLTLDSTPRGAALTVDGEARGRTPTVLELPNGKHRVELSLDGHTPYGETLECIGGNVSRVFTLTALGGAAVQPAPAPAPAGGEAPLIPGRPGAPEGVVWFFFEGRKGDVLKVNGQDFGALPVKQRMAEGTYTFEVVGPSGTWTKTRELTLNDGGESITMAYLQSW